MTPEDDRRDTPETRPEGIIETALEEAQAQLDRIKDRARVFAGSFVYAQLWL